MKRLLLGCIAALVLALPAAAQTNKVGQQLVCDGTNANTTTITVKDAAGATQTFDVVTGGTARCATVKAASAAAAATDLGLVVSMSPNGQNVAWAGGTLGAMANYGTSPGAVLVPGVNAFITNAPTVAQATAANLNATVVGTGTFATQAAQSGTWNIGTVTTLTTLSTLTGGGVASGAADSGNPVKIGCKYNASGITALADGNRGDCQMDSAANLKIGLGAMTTTGTGWTTATGLNATQTIMAATMGAPAVLVQLDQTSTLTVGAVTFECTYDAVPNWVSLPVAQIVNPNTFANLTNPYTLVASTNQPFLLLTQGCQQLRLRLSTQITGTATVTPYITLLPYNPAIGALLNPLAAGTAIIGKVGIDQTTDNSTNAVSAHGAVNVTPTDCSIALTTGGAAQNIIAANAGIHGFTIANIDTAAGSGEPIWVSFTTTAAASTIASYPLSAPTATTFAGLSSYTTPIGFGSNANVSVIAATTGHKISCTRW